MKLLTLVLLIASFATGYVFHAMDYGSSRNGWFAWHRTLGLAALLIALAISTIAPGRASGRWTRRIDAALGALLAAMVLSGWIAVSAWSDPAGSGTLIGGIRLPLIPKVSYDIGNSGEQLHKLAAMFFVWLTALRASLLLRTAWCRRAQTSASSP